MNNPAVHTIKPVYDKNSKILILGTMPSPKSREIGFYYGHPQNRFWVVLYKIFGENLPDVGEAGICEKENFLLRHKIAVWDVLKSCEIDGASDSSIKNPIPNDLSIITNIANIKAVFTTGKKAAALYKKYNDYQSVEVYSLPSTSPANCRYYTLDNLVEEYKIILKYLK